MMDARILILLSIMYAGSSQTGPAEMIPYVGEPVFVSTDPYVRIHIKSPPIESKRGKADIMAVIPSESDPNNPITADCPNSDYKHDINRGLIVFESSFMSCVAKFRSSLLGYWSKPDIAFAWNPLDLTLAATFGTPFVLKFDADATMKAGRDFDLVGFLL